MEEVGARDVYDAIASGRRFEYAGDATRALHAYGTALALADTPVLRAEAVRRVGDAHRGRRGTTRSRRTRRAAPSRTRTAWATSRRRR